MLMCLRMLRRMCVCVGSVLPNCFSVCPVSEAAGVCVCVTKWSDPGRLLGFLVARICFLPMRPHAGHLYSWSSVVRRPSSVVRCPYSVVLRYCCSYTPLLICTTTLYPWACVFVCVWLCVYVWLCLCVSDMDSKTFLSDFPKGSN